MIPPGTSSQDAPEKPGALDEESSLRRQVKPVRDALAACRKAFGTAAVFSVFINLLMLVPVIYMLQIYDRVLTSGNETTLWFLSGIVIFLMIVMGALEWLRTQMLIVASARMDAIVSPQLHDALFMRALVMPEGSNQATPLSDLNQLRQFMTGPGFFAFFDAPWVVIYVGVMYLFHPWIGTAALCSVLVLVALASFNEWATRDLMKKSAELNQSSGHQTTVHLRNAELVQAMGMVPRLRERWASLHESAITAQHLASRRAGMIAAVSRTFRLIMQSMMLGLGAYLALRKDISGGAVLAGSILLGRALAPVDMVIGQWRGVIMARDAYARLNKLLRVFGGVPEPMPLPPPEGNFKVEGLSITPAGLQKPILRSLSFNIPKGAQIAIVGPSAAGKSTLVRALLGLYTPSEGSVRLDGAEISQRDRAALGKHIGYLPQDVELLTGTVAENIARFGAIDPDAVVEAARLAGVHEMILSLPNGYDSQIGQGFSLSAGQKQRIALARAVYGTPSVVLLDEPNANLDEAGDLALAHALLKLRKAGTTVILVTHRQNIVQNVDLLMLLVNGQIAAFGTREQVTQALKQAKQKEKIKGPERAAGDTSGNQAAGNVQHGKTEPHLKQVQG